MIIDSHAHFWKNPTDMSLAQGAPHEPIGVEQFIQDMDDAGISAVIQITRGLMGFDNRYSIESAARFPDRIRVMGRFDVLAPNRVERLRTWRADPMIVGIRMMTMARDESARFSDGSLDGFWGEAELVGLPIAIYAPDNALLIDRIATRHPDLKIIVDHVGMRVFDIFGSTPSMHDWPNLITLKRHPNVTIKVSGIPEALVEKYPFPNSQQRLFELFENFGPDRLMWGSNYPLVTQVCTYRQALDFVREECTFLSASDKTKILCETAASVLGLPWGR
jgi:predicted TIM-barrel fold metal-dependent hydrolase